MIADNEVDIEILGNECRNELSVIFLMLSMEFLDHTSQTHSEKLIYPDSDTNNLIPHNTIPAI